MQIIKDGKIVQDDWRHIADDESLPTGRFTVSFARWQAEGDILKSAGGEIGLRIRGEDAVETIAGDLNHFTLICIDFPTMADGRGFSLARLLRERYGFHEEIRARGDFIRDQMFFLSRVGVNAFECPPEQSLEALLPALQEFTVKYQAAVDEKEPLYRRR
ncbi:MAG TPA: DUF934 domain-containing protein [Methylococcaceae bacterium]|jgi:uncharacterized protein (DUF934 family)|nr:DUF934 domain-containing protein [Methylococcaceae bacterium]